MLEFSVSFLYKLTFESGEIMAVGAATLCLAHCLYNYVMKDLYSYVTKDLYSYAMKDLYNYVMKDLYNYVMKEASMCGSSSYSVISQVLLFSSFLLLLFPHAHPTSPVRRYNRDG